MHSKILLMGSIALLSLTQAQAQRRYVERAIEKKYEEEHGKPGAEKGNDWIQNKLLNVKVEPQYKFTKYSIIRITNFKKKEVKEQTDITYHFANHATLIGIEVKTVNATDKKKKSKDDDMFNIYDYKANSMVLLNITEKTGMAINLNAFMSQENIDKRARGETTPRTAQKNNDCRRTGKTKTIKGVLCEEWVCVDEERETRSELWVNAKNTYAMDAQRRGPMAGYLARHNINGLIMEGLFYKRGELESQWETIEINNNANTVINTTDYSFNR